MKKLAKSQPPSTHKRWREILREKHPAEVSERGTSYDMHCFATICGKRAFFFHLHGVNTQSWSILYWGRSGVSVLCIVRYWVTSAASTKDCLAFDCNSGESQWLRIYWNLGDTSQQEWNVQSIFIQNIFTTSLYTIHSPLSEFYSIFFSIKLKL